MKQELSDVFTKRADGFCESCDYGFDQCIKDGKPKCEEEVNEDEQQESV